MRRGGATAAGGCPGRRGRGGPGGLPDLIRQEGRPNRRTITWMLVILLVPLIGPILYFVFGTSPIPASVRNMLVAGSLGAYVAIAALAVVVGGS